MIKPDISIGDYTYNLPDERIAKYPLANRDESKLLVYKGGRICEQKFPDILKELPESSMLAFNNTKVIRARLKFQKATGAEIEIFCLEPLAPAEVQMAFDSRKQTTWKCIVGNARKWKSGALNKEVCINGVSFELSIVRGERMGDASAISFNWENANFSFAEIIEEIGLTPIPPYLNRETEDIDKDRYQTVYSEHQGSVAAPTAGLHFTGDILRTLEQRNHPLLNVTLHVGAGTFKPVKSEVIAEHDMHTEHFVIEKVALERLLSHNKKLIAVGTTSVRTLESLYWYGVRLLMGLPIDNGVEQWDAYNLNGNYSKKEAFEALMKFMETKKLSHLAGKTAIIIVPGYGFKVINGLVTNFHQPQSTLLLLIGAIVGKEWKTIYDYALENDFRFLSYGDSSLLMIEE
ncbi:S-adenosylmethionine:tRNA ribosyltransferase-isomerase [Carboxylicivirga marina]|uniref:S-adenosylmethionine:tRNA ribosyltransferase-isomerase n=2 Tax=Carboxylicivirga marina TaxID=2800988 RepID=A0ABS1HFD1_9BACT|nr:S-adenosylmethionine:tRNA ribosyltransferase-isomerase [Carboxylicivirga marina]MBK3516377.1 S-adenosylmethionine:tRNA ribosyltransferase-isomerase [Carboxylicivirga marina]